MRGRSEVLPLSVISLLLAFPCAGWPAVQGRVLDESGEPVGNARVEARTGGEGQGGLQVAISNGDGEFVLPEVVVPADLYVSHPVFESVIVRLASGEDQPVEVTLSRRYDFQDDVTVQGRYPGDRFSPDSVASTAVVPREAVAPSSSVAEAVSGIAGVAENGQGGLFQVVSVRGISGQRVLSHVDGARITSERRAGVALSFLDPTLIGEVDVQRGAASTYYGSGALGGALQVLPRRFERLDLDLGYGSQGDERWVAVGRGAPSWSMGLAHRRRSAGESADGRPLNDGFVQASATAEGHVGAGPRRDTRLSAVLSYGQDIGKSNSDFPARTTAYPRERHLLLTASSETASGRMRLFVHPQDLYTEVKDDVSRSTVDDESLDFGLLWERDVSLGPRVEGRFGIDAFGRRGVQGVERSTPVGGGETVESGSLRGGQEDEVAAVGIASWRWSRVRFEAGGRGTAIRQGAQGKETETGSHLTGFAAATFSVHRRLELSGTVGRGFRIPSLSERFFVGTTGRGEVVGNPELAPESAMNAELGVRYTGDRSAVRASFYRNRIGGYIERIAIEPGLYTFRNLTSGVLRGLELSGLSRLAGHWNLSFAAHRIRGTGDDGQTLTDFPADRLHLEPRFSGRRLSAGAALVWRRGRRSVGPGETPIDEATLVDLSLGWRLPGELKASLWVRNLFDELYSPSADAKAAPAPGRSVGLDLTWGKR